MIARADARTRALVALVLGAAAGLATSCGSPAAGDTDGAGSAPASTPSPVTGVPVDARTTLSDLAYDARGRLLALGETGVRIVGTGRIVRTATAESRTSAEALSVQPNGHTLLLHAYGAGGRELVRARRLEDPRPRWTATIPRSRFGYPQVHWSASGGRFIVETERGDAIYSAGTGRRLGLLHPSYDAYLGDQPLSPDGRQVAYPAAHGLTIWTVATRRARTIELGHVAHAPAWSPDGRTIALAERNLVLVDVATGRTRTVPSPGALQSVTWSPDGRYVAAYGDDPDASDAGHPAYRITVFDVATGASWDVGRLVDGPEFEPLAWSADSRRVAYQRRGG